MCNRSRRVLIVSLGMALTVLLSAFLAGVAMAQSTHTVTIQLDASTGRSLCVFSTAPTSWGSDHSTSVLAFGNYVGPETGLTHQCRSYLWFPLAAIPANVTINTASLELYVGDWPFDGSGAMGVYRVTADWDESFSWGTRPAAESVPLDSTTIDSGTGWRAWDVTALAREWASGEAANHGLMAASAPTPDHMVGNGWACAAPGRTSGEATRTPRLVVTYTQAPVSTEIPEPATVILVGAGLAGLTALLAARRRR